MERKVRVKAQPTRKQYKQQYEILRRRAQWLRRDNARLKAELERVIARVYKCALRNGNLAPALPEIGSDIVICRAPDDPVGAHDIYVTSAGRNR